MRTPLSLLLAAGVAATGASAVAAKPAKHAPAELRLASQIRETVHRGQDDLLTAGLGLEGLRSTTSPPFADADAPSAEELRRRAIWSNWRGIADLGAGGGIERVPGGLKAVPGREFQAFVRLPGSLDQTHRVLLQLPDNFDQRRRCVVVAPASGSRGVYGAIALAAPWAFAHRCAVAYTDKGAGTGWYDFLGKSGAGLDGRPSQDADAVEFADRIVDGRPVVGIKHLHSRGNPEAHWGVHVRQAAQFALQVLNTQRKGRGKAFSAENTRIIAVGLSNGGGAVLRAAEADDGLLDAVLAAAPNVFPGEGGRPLFDYATEAAIYLPCALAHSRYNGNAWARRGNDLLDASRLRCTALQQGGLLQAEGVPAQAAEAYERLRASGWSEVALDAAAASTALDLWRAIGAGYAAAYTRTGAYDMPCGYFYAMSDGSGQPRPATAAERAAWWSDSSGIPPGAGVVLHQTLAAGIDPQLGPLRCLRGLLEGDARDFLATSLQASVRETQAALPREGLPLLLMHGLDDGLVPEAFASAAYSEWLQRNGREHAYWRLANVQHFDSLLGLPGMGARYLPLLPYAWHGLDALWARLQDGTPLPASRTVQGRPRVVGDESIEPISAQQLDLP